jgi:hypothetical protein
VLSYCGLSLPPTCLLVTANEACSYFASTIRLVSFRFEQIIVAVIRQKRNAEHDAVSAWRMGRYTAEFSWLSSKKKSKDSLEKSPFQWLPLRLQTVVWIVGSCTVLKRRPVKYAAPEALHAAISDRGKYQICCPYIITRELKDTLWKLRITFLCILGVQFEFMRLKYNL